jgi:hypothetical protein
MKCTTIGYLGLSFVGKMMANEIGEGEWCMVMIGKGIFCSFEISSLESWCYNTALTRGLTLVCSSRVCHLSSFAFHLTEMGGLSHCRA